MTRRYTTYAFIEKMNRPQRLHIEQFTLFVAAGSLENYQPCTRAQTKLSLKLVHAAPIPSGPNDRRSKCRLFALPLHIVELRTEHLNLRRNLVDGVNFVIELAAEGFHDRMPVILHRDDYERWLSLEPDPYDLMKPFPADLMKMWPIGRGVGSPRNNTPDIIEEIDPDPELL